MISQLNAAHVHSGNGRSAEIYGSTIGGAVVDRVKHALSFRPDDLPPDSLVMGADLGQDASVSPIAGRVKLTSG
jgi:hypothetical protein